MTPAVAISISFSSSPAGSLTLKYLVRRKAHGHRERPAGLSSSHTSRRVCQLSSLQLTSLQTCWRRALEEQLKQTPDTEAGQADQEFFHRPPEACGLRRKRVRYLTYRGAKQLQGCTCFEKFKYV